MAFSFTHRKLLISPNNSTITTVETCLYFCNTTKIDTISTPKGFCPTPCLEICPSTCHFSLSTIFTLGDSSSRPNKPHNPSPLLISMLILLAFTFLLITFYVLYIKLYSFFYHNTPSNSNIQNNPMNFLDGEHGPTRVFHPIWYISTVGLNPTVIKSIKVQTCEKTIEGSDCAVCLGEFVIGDEMRILPKCNHAFHVHCIDTWLKSHVSCPLCRAPIYSGHDQGYGQTCDVSTTTTIIRGDHEVVENDDEFPRDEAVIHVNSNGEGCLEENKGSSSQKWCWERGAASLVSRSLSCSGKIFSSRYNNKPGPNSSFS